MRSLFSGLCYDIRFINVVCWLRCRLSGPGVYFVQSLAIYWDKWGRQQVAVLRRILTFRIFCDFGLLFFPFLSSTWIWRNDVFFIAIEWLLIKIVAICHRLLSSSCSSSSSSFYYIDDNFSFCLLDIISEFANQPIELFRRIFSLPFWFLAILRVLSAVWCVIWLRHRSQVSLMKKIWISLSLSLDSYHLDAARVLIGLWSCGPLQIKGFLTTDTNNINVKSWLCDQVD